MNEQDSIRLRLKADLMQGIEALGQQQSLLPNQAAQVNDLVQQLEALTPIATPLHLSHRAALLGTWQLIYTSQGTVVTRRLTDWMGFTIERVWQTLTGEAAQQVEVTNGAELSFPVIGRWRLQAQGSWQWNTNDQLATVAFEAFSTQAIALFGQPSWVLPELKIPVLEQFRREALWRTSYLDQDLRVGRGVTGNLFVFARLNR